MEKEENIKQDSSIYSEVYSQISYEITQKNNTIAESTLKSTSINKSTKFFKNFKEGETPNIKENKRYELRSKLKKKIEDDFSDYESVKEDNDAPRPAIFEREEIREGCCRNNQCFIY